ncbi:hypothetical protein BDA99DRAFT_554087 [Phascolomyces articulosus]|uniref:Uncharacterized protein n=1 Tax=Phascolomyces articulosus TaxID=60185 RepID=A0AAD5KR99_9FUNG|nr:hypothetical protein BDA99DRAFT_554087 [Phascolomyces articulosus]
MQPEPTKLASGYLATYGETGFQLSLVSKRWRSYVFYLPHVFFSMTMCLMGENGFTATLPPFIMMEKVIPCLTSTDSRDLMPEKVKKKYRSILENVNLDQMQEIKTDMLNPYGSSFFKDVKTTDVVDAWIIDLALNIKSTGRLGLFRNKNDKLSELIFRTLYFNDRPMYWHLAQIQQDGAITNKVLCTWFEIMRGQGRQVLYDILSILIVKDSKVPGL